MVFCVLHLDDEPRRDGDEEVYVIVPHGSRTAIAVPLDALPRFLPLLERALGEAPLPECSACAAPIPRFAAAGGKECRSLERG